MRKKCRCPVRRRLGTRAGAVQPNIVLDLRGMNQILKLTSRRSARVRPESFLEALDKVNDVGFILGHDPWTVPVARGWCYLDQ
jgi:hypothetical protein